MERLEKIVQKYLKDSNVSDTDDLFEHGLDSLNLLRLIIELEEEIGIFVDLDDLDYENFSTIKNMREYIKI